MHINLKKIKKNIIDECEKKLRKSNLADQTLCGLVQFIHVFFSVFSFICILFGSKMWFCVSGIMCVLAAICFFLFNGCLVTMLEHRFSTDNFVIIDPFLMVLNMQITNENRYTYSIVSGGLSFLVIGLMYYIRFGLTNPKPHIFTDMLVNYCFCNSES
jgi:hypothetical protein